MIARKTLKLSREKRQTGFDSALASGSSSLKLCQLPGYILLLLLVAIFVLSLGLLVAVPVLETQLQREKEEELIFRGKQYLEAISSTSKKPAPILLRWKSWSRKNASERFIETPCRKMGSGTCY